MKEKITLKNEVAQYWNQASCGTSITLAKKFSKAYFQAIEEHRYTQESEIFSFAQFTRFYGKKVLEVGVGAGTDFTQWVRAGTKAYGIDLTQEAIENTKKRLALGQLNPVELQVADAEQLPYEDNFFDCVYSWGVIHHSPDTLQCLKEMIRVAKSGASIKFMVYNRYSINTFLRWFHIGFLRGKPFQTLSTILYHHQESKGTKAFTIKEMRRMVSQFPVTIRSISAPMRPHDFFTLRSKMLTNIVHYVAIILSFLAGRECTGFYMLVELTKNKSL